MCQSPGDRILGYGALIGKESDEMGHSWSRRAFIALLAPSVLGACAPGPVHQTAVPSPATAVRATPPAVPTPPAPSATTAAVPTAASPNVSPTIAPAIPPPTPVL